MPCILKIKFNFVLLSQLKIRNFFENFLRPLFCQFLVKSAKTRPQIFFSAAPFELFGRNFCHLATLGSTTLTRVQLFLQPPPPLCVCGVSCSAAVPARRPDLFNAGRAGTARRAGSYWSPILLQTADQGCSHSIAETGSWDRVCWCDRVKMAQQCDVICS